MCSLFFCVYYYILVHYKFRFNSVLTQKTLKNVRYYFKSQTN